MMKRKNDRHLRSSVHTEGPANKDVPESAIAEQSLAQNPAAEYLSPHNHNQRHWTIKTFTEFL